MLDMSHPTRVRGLKFLGEQIRWQSSSVAPYTGAWIEIAKSTIDGLVQEVAPYTGAWIEIFITSQSLNPKNVAPYTGAWIEI